ncbi:MAG: hypothetical protein JST68_18530 [Bacteroidetes bacterium]|nr:hypothetical protein [Bacteroidota bacterium]
MKALASLITLTLLTVAAYSQNTINNYKYVLMPERFDFSKMDNQYGLNTTAKSLLEQKGFTVVWVNGELPPAVASNKCNALRAEMTQHNTIFTTGLTLLLKDCQGNVVFKSKEGKSREKEFETAYAEALRNSFASLNETPYKYDSSAVQQTAIPLVATQQVPAQQTPAAQTGTTPAATTTPPVTPAAETKITGTLYAQPLPNGYQLIDTTPKKVLTLLKTSVDDYYIADASNGIVFKKNNEWFFEYYKDGKLVSQKLEIKF